MIEKRIGFNNILRSQLPEYVREEFPLISEFLSQYYISQEYQGAPIDLIQNIDKYVKVDQISETIESVTLKSDINFEEETIEIDLEKSPSGTRGFPKSYGLIKIDDEIITYTGITSTSFVGCIRGFSGIDSYKVSNSPDVLSFRETNSSSHKSGSTIINLSSLFLKEFLIKTKYQLLPGFESREIYNPIKESLLIKQAKDFYSSKGSDNSFKILFNALYGKDVVVLKPKDNLIRPSDANYEVTNDFIVEVIEGDPIDLIDSTLRQDEYQNYTKAYAPITNVQKIQTKTGENYYRLSIDSGYSRDIIVDGATYGDFSVHPKTKAIEEHSVGSTEISVDSTLGFSDSGELYVEYEDNTFGIVNYTSKSINQFYGCSNVTKKILDNSIITVNTFAYGSSIQDENQIIKVRILSVIDDIILNDSRQNFYHVPKTELSIKTLGIDATDYISNNWLFNISPLYKNVSFEEISNNGSSHIYKIKTKSQNIFESGDSVEFIPNKSGEKFETLVIQKNDIDSITVQLNRQLSNDSIYNIRRKLLKTKSLKYPGLSNVICNVQNTYKQGESIFVASNSLPSYTIETDDLSVSGQFNILDEYTFECETEHPFSTGDIVYYTPDNSSFQLADEGIYNVKKISNTRLKFSKGNSNLNKSIFVSLESSSSGKIEFYQLKSKSLKPQNLLRNISSPINDEFIYSTKSEKIGILKNGVEILNYKSKDKILYGRIESVDVLSPGNDYDVINPPNLIIEDSYGTGAKGYCSVEGSLRDIRVLDSGFDYIEIPQIKISGGNGSGALAVPNIKFVDHIVDFDSESQVVLGSEITSKIGFSTYHRFRDGEKVLYKSNGFENIGGLVSNSSYYITIVSPTEIKLHKNLEDVITGTAVSFTSYGIGRHSIKSSTRKITLGSISILNSGSGYQNKKRTVQPTGINTSLGIISIKNHGFKSGEIVRYKTEGTSISGLTDNKDYILTSIDEDRFSLSEVGIGSTNINFYFNTKKYVKLSSSGIGTHTFNYPPISVEILGKIGISTVGGINQDNFKAKILPDFKGSITSVHISDNGVGYGSSDIINFDRQPSITTFSGSGAFLRPIVNGGKIVDVLIIFPGEGYITTPILSVVGSGSGAVLFPIVENKKIISVKIIEPGSGYDKNNTSISIKEKGSGAKFYARLQNWNINLVERFKKYFKSDDGFITNSLDIKNELQYTHLYCPRNLIEIESSNKHSPIIGWAYDGNPIYGPYAYLSADGISSITRMKSSYELITTNSQNKNRPSSSNFPLGFFIEDYEYLYNNNSEFLDENNGRFCITPEFPLGTYAYFSTLDSIGSDSFSEYKNPVFPYFVGNTYKSKPNDLNFSPLFNQSLDLNSLGLTRNTSPYGLLDENTEYTYLNNQNYRLKPAEIKSVSPGIVENIRVVFGGDGYKVNDTLSFDNEGTKGFGAYAKVVEIGGKSVQSISAATTSINNIEFYANSLDNSIIGISEYPHGLKNEDLISIVGINSSFILDSYRIGVSTNSLVLSKSVSSSGATGLITYFSVYGQLDLKENDILKIESERVKVLKIDRISSRIKVLRRIDGTVGSAHSASTIIYEDPRKFAFKNDGYFSLSQNINKEIYFNPSESLGIGTQFGVGIGKTLVFSNPGAGITQIFIPTRAIYLPDHQLETGDELIYNIQSGGTSILVSTNGTTNFTLPDKSKLYTAKISNDLIGISTVKVGLGTTGSFVGVTTQTKNSSILYFLGVGIGSNHSFKTNYDVALGKVLKNTTTVILKEDPKLNKGDSVTVSVNPSISTSISIKYNDYNRRLVTNTLNFSSSGINTVNGTIQIINHNLVNGQKVIYNSNTPPTQLSNNGIYFVSLVDENTIQLSDSFYNSTLKPPITLGLSTASNGSISLINPPIRLYKSSTVTFDLSDSSLSYTQSGTNYSAFDFNIYKDSSFTEVFDKLNSSTLFDVEKIGSIGIDTNAKLILNVKEDFPQKLYYKLTPIAKNPNLPNSKKEIIIDSSVFSNSTLEILDSFYNGRYFVSSSSTNSFTYFTPNKPESVSYSSTSTTIEYTTNSLTSNGPISRVQVTNGGRNYFTLPKISKINSILGSNAILEPSSQSIGKINKVNIKDLGFDFSPDYTLKPSCYPIINVTVDPLYSFESIGITSYGVGYNFAPKLIIIDSKTQEVIDDLDLEFDLNKSEVTILKNTFKLSEIPPKIIPIQNTNGVGISSVSYNPANKKVTAILSEEFDTLESFPFSLGDKIFVENVNIEGEGTGYNSEDYDYSLFEIIEVYDNIGVGFAEIVYSLENFLENNQTPGKYSSSKSFGRVILEKHFPTFSSKLKRGEYLIGERLTSNSIDFGKVSYWNSLNGFLLITESNVELVAGQQINGASSNTTSNIKEVFKTDLSCNLGAKTKIINGWRKNIGFLNEDSQKIQDSFYYQNFSYSLKSNVNYDTWKDAVLTLNHPRGFKVFSDYQLESENYVGLSTEINSSIVEVTLDITSVTDTNTYFNFDTAKETSVEINSNLISDEIIFDSKTLSNYILSIGNKVVGIDDISSQFNSNSNVSKRDFDLKNNGNDIFKRIFVGNDSNIVNIDSNTITIKDHFFVTGEKISYNNGSNSSANSIGIGTTDFGIGIGITNKLPTYVYVVKVDDSKIKLARNAEDSLNPIPKTLDIVNVGIGSTHYFLSTNQNSRVLIAIDNIIQSPIVSTSVTTIVSQNISSISTSIYFSGISSFFSGDLVKINNEIMKIESVGVGSTNILSVNRSWMGTSASEHSIGNTATKLIGDYNIVENTINFYSSPYGEQLDANDGLPSIKSSFQGRVFIKSGTPNNNKDTYSNNYIFDDISDGFVGTSSAFTLKSNNSNITGISTDNIVLLVNNIFQVPSYSNNVQNIINNYSLEENSGLTTIYFTGSNVIPNPSDINTSSLPINGIIVSVGSTGGFGYQPLVCAGGTVTVSSSGTISSISIGNSGSGYRVGVQPVINVGVKTSNIFGSKIEFIGTATVSGGNVVGVSITNPAGIGHTNYIPRYNSRLISKVSAGSTEISISSLENIKIKNYVSIGTFFSNVEVVGIGTTVFYIGTGSTSQYEVPKGTDVIIKEYGPIVVFDNPLPYSNIPLVYSPNSSGTGTQASVDIVVGNGSSIINFEIKNFGYRYKTGDILTVNVGGATGIPTDTSKQFNEFQIVVNEVRNDKFSGWFIGRLQPIDDISGLFNGRRRSFRLKYTEGSSVYSLVSEKGSKIDMNYNILVFLNDVLQVPYDSYVLSPSGSRIIFSTPPNGRNDENLDEGDTCKILFYMGNSEYDTLPREILQSVKIGDKLQLNYDERSNQPSILAQDERMVDSRIDSIEVSEVKTLPYFGPGISEDETLSRPIFWKKQVEDIILNSKIIGKDRQPYEPKIQPKAYLINSVGVQSSSIFVDNVRPFFNPKNESIVNNYFFQNEIELISQDTKETGIATAIVSAAGTISAINIISGGKNYSTPPIVTLESPVGFGTTLRSTAISSITSGIITSILVTYGGTEYSTTNSPAVLIEPPKLETEKIKVFNYFGDYGIISGISTGSVAGVASTAIIFDLFIPSDSDLKNSSLTGISGITTISGIQTGYYFIVYNSNVGNGVTSLDSSGSVIGIGTTCLDNVYQAASVSIATSYVPAENEKQVLKVVVSVSSYNGLTGIGFSNFYGEYSWGKIDLNNPTKNSYNSYRTNGISGIGTGGLVRRYAPLKYFDYST